MNLQTATQIHQQKSSVTPPASSLLQRKCACGTHTMAGGECEGFSKKQTLQRPSISPRGRGDPSIRPPLRTGERVESERDVPPIVHEVLCSPGQPLDPATHAFFDLHSGHDFSKVRVQDAAALKIQPKLLVNEPGDRYEQEADRIAATVMRLADPGVSKHTLPPSVQRLTTGEGSPDAAPPIVHDVLSSPGQPLDATARAFFEPRFGRDFSRVRVHTDAKAADSARVLNAVAYTVGEDVVFGADHYAPQAEEGRRLLAHELTHVVQQRGGGDLRIQRSLAGCQDLLSDPNVVSLIPGSLVHRIIAAHFRQTVAGARSVVIPGASAGPLRSEGLCGGPKPVIDPQMVGGMSGAGFPDLARITTGGILQVAEIKPAAVPCLVDGEEQFLRYIDQGNARDAAQIAWRASLGVTVVSPLLENAYTPPSFRVTAPGVASAELKTAWCTPGLLAYTVKVSGEPVRVPVPQRQRAEARERLRQEAASSAAPVAVGVGVAIVAAVAGRALWRHFWRAVIQRFAIRGAIALALSAADGPLPFGELISLGLAAVTVIQIISDWNNLWREADRIAAEGA